MSPILLLFLAASLLAILVALITIITLRYHRKHRDEGLLFDSKTLTPEDKRLKKNMHMMVTTYNKNMAEKITEKTNEILTKIDSLRALNPESADEVAETYQTIVDSKSNPTASEKIFNELVLLLADINARLASLGLYDAQQFQDFEKSFAIQV